MKMNPPFIWSFLILFGSIQHIDPEHFLLDLYLSLITGVAILNVVPFKFQIQIVYS